MQVWRLPARVMCIDSRQACQCGEDAGLSSITATNRLLCVSDLRHEFYALTQALLTARRHLCMLHRE